MFGPKKKTRLFECSWRRRDNSSSCLTEKGMAFHFTQPARKWVPPLGSYKLASDPAPAVGGGFGAWRQARRWGRSQQWRGTSTACWHLVLTRKVKPLGYWISFSRYEEILHSVFTPSLQRRFCNRFLGGFYPWIIVFSTASPLGWGQGISSSQDVFLNSGFVSLCVHIAWYSNGPGTGHW